MEPFGVIILAAGNSERMGKHKALLPFGNNRSFIEQITEIYLETGAKKIVLVINSSIFQTVMLMPISQQKKVAVTENNEPDKGRLHSIKLGLEKFDNLPIFIQNVDNPFVKVELIQNLYNHLKPNTYVSPCFENSVGHPVLISHEIVNEINRCKLDIPLYEILAGFKQVKLQQNNPQVLVNINTPEDYRFAFK